MHTLPSSFQISNSMCPPENSRESIGVFRCNETRVRITLQGTVSQCTFDQFGGCSKQTKMKKYFNIGASEPVSGQRKNCNKLRSAAQRTHLVVWSYWTVAGPQN